MIDLDKDQAISRYELRRFLDSVRIYATDNDVQMLMNKFDMNRDYKITLEEFANELIPKLGRLNDSNAN